MKYDDILHVLNGFGIYQKIVILLAIIPVCFNGITTMMLVFLLGDHAHRCRLPDIVDDRYTTISEKNNLTIYNTSQCFLYLNGTNIPCTNWVYDTSIYTSTLISKFNMVCQSKFMRSNILLSHFFGAFINAILCGLACDRWGRITVYVAGIILSVLPNLIRPWMPNLWLVAFCEFLNATGSNICYVVPFIIVTEMVDPPHRVLASFAIYISYCLGEHVLLIYAYFIRDWETLIIVVAVPITVCFLIFIFLPESPRWLLVKGKTEQAMKILQNMAYYNKTVINFDPNDITIKEEYMVSILEGFKIIIKSKEMMKRFCILFFNWFSISFIYFGISMNTGDLGGDVYINYLISTTIETVGVMACFFAERLPRKRLYCSVMVIGGAACLSTILTSIYGGQSLHWLTLSLAMIGKLGVTAAFFIIYLITTEVFPTVIRASVFGLCNMAARIGGMLSAYIGKLGILLDSRYGMALPLIIFGSCGITAGFLALFLPETRNIELPETFKDTLDIDNFDESSHLNAGEEKLEMCNDANELELTH